MPQTNRVFGATVVDNPNFQSGYDEDATNPREIPVSVNLRESAVVSLAVRGKLEPHQVAAADRFRQSFEVANGLRSSAMGERVSYSSTVGSYGARLAQACKDLQQARYLLGQDNMWLVTMVCGQGKALGDLYRDKRDKLTAADNLRSSLDNLAQMWGLMQAKPTTPDVDDNGTQPANS